ncbi:MAG TPA: TetR/AcrR family transcriptional regulator, partial [Solirubrobacteraceae bacterium]|nr:TetR/AcrR family transcriptional regulator [Solirubrobacteraceae bacterium]
LLYHYFPSKQDYFMATLADGAEELRARVEPDPALPPAQALAGAVDAYLAWVEDNGAAYAKLFKSVATVPEVHDLVEGVRAATAERIIDGLDAAGNPRARVAVRGWLWFMDGACLDWITHGDLDRGEMHGLLLGTLAGALLAAGVALPPG